MFWAACLKQQSMRNKGRRGGMSCKHLSCRKPSSLSDCTNDNADLDEDSQTDQRYTTLTESSPVPSNEVTEQVIHKPTSSTGQQCSEFCRHQSSSNFDTFNLGCASNREDNDLNDTDAAMDLQHRGPTVGRRKIVQSSVTNDRTLTSTGRPLLCRCRGVTFELLNYAITSC